MGTTRYGTRLSIKKSQLDAIGGGGGADARTIYTRTFTVTSAQLVAKGGIKTSSFALFTLAANEGIRWAWTSTPTAFVGSGSNNTYVKVGWTAQNGGLLTQVQVDILNAINDDAGDHSAFGFGVDKAMGDAASGSQARDGVPLMGTSKPIVAYMETSANHDTLSAGLLYIHIEIVRYDTTQVEAST